MWSFLVQKAYALDFWQNPVSGTFGNLGDAINTVFRVIVYAAAVIFLLLFIVGGIQYLTSAGNEEASGKAKKLLVDAIIGLIIVLLAWAAGTWILNQLGLNAGQIPTS